MFALLKARYWDLKYPGESTPSYTRLGGMKAPWPRRTARWIGANWFALVTLALGVAGLFVAWLH